QLASLSSAFFLTLLYGDFTEKNEKCIKLPLVDDVPTLFKCLFLPLLLSQNDAYCSSPAISWLRSHCPSPSDRLGFESLFSQLAEEVVRRATSKFSSFFRAEQIAIA
ncbi:hypothetical protein PFISCL1PPCAC_25461, partial [Pristionchus fissidentatus]